MMLKTQTKRKSHISFTLFHVINCCTGGGCGKVHFLHSILHGCRFWFCDLTSVDNSPKFWSLLSCSTPHQDFFLFLTVPPAGVVKNLWGYTAEKADLNWFGRYSYCMMSYSGMKSQRKQEGPEPLMVMAFVLLGSHYMNWGPAFQELAKNLPAVRMSK